MNTKEAAQLLSQVRSQEIALGYDNLQQVCDAIEADGTITMYAIP